MTLTLTLRHRLSNIFFLLFICPFGQAVAIMALLSRLLFVFYCLRFRIYIIKYIFPHVFTVHCFMFFALVKSNVGRSLTFKIL